MPSPQQPDSAPEPEEEQKLDFGKPVDLKRLLALAKPDQRALDSAIRWFDENASDSWKGALG